MQKGLHSGSSWRSGTRGPLDPNMRNKNSSKNMLVSPGEKHWNQVVSNTVCLHRHPSEHCRLTPRAERRSHWPRGPQLTHRAQLTLPSDRRPEVGPGISPPTCMPPTASPGLRPWQGRATPVWMGGGTGSSLAVSAAPCSERDGDYLGRVEKWAGPRGKLTSRLGTEHRLQGLNGPFLQVPLV